MDINIIDVTNWQVDDEHAIFPLGARDKKMLWSPSDGELGIKPNWPYLFKQSRKAFPDQFWMEVVAFIVGCSMGVLVPKAFPAKMVNKDGQTEYGALLEWFYDKDKQTFVHASDFFHKIISNFDDSNGCHHNLIDLQKICRAFSFYKILTSDWRTWLWDMLLFDAMIGNTDRHQENWGFVFESTKDTKIIANLSPFFDNGTSLGHERYVENVSDWRHNRLDKYIEKGQHHLRINREDNNIKIGHISSIQCLICADEKVEEHLKKRLNFSFEELEQSIRKLCLIKAGVPFSKERADWTIRLLRRRYQRLSLIINMRIINKIIEPNKLLLTWQPTSGGTRYVVAHIERLPSDEYIFEYHLDSDDYAEAEEKGFKGHPAFDHKNKVHKINVLEPFTRRLPPKKRGDFSEYLRQHRLPYPFSGSDFALLAYTGAKSPGDGFSLVPDPSVVKQEGELLLEVAGTRYEKSLDLERVIVGDRVELKLEPDNKFDPNAIAVMHEAGRLGYVNKVLCKELKSQIQRGKISAFVVKKNGTLERPLIYLLIECHV